ncbi:hypothetical protein ABB37_05972 [Leptomonas pyrrhocoris]|uniref:CSD domain-containing protein n=1 Tax=Leptomonas pyrrhocoris TaxID=157538 RepID=A0A0N0VEV8_LEPPY|nr:hypothetical protein ABB37_05972 [Leptomonas pyrrhocoris]KPA78908.1 hypothetical protein ABB37_05972 [Leptomonas pyrrhocoris]|eukprot:XP_015657347.1 hypothetical protein ABB37_05972 [Leptomonas pyrrhocoris]
MFHAASAHTQPQTHSTKTAATTSSKHQSQQSMYPITNATMFQGFPMTMNDGRAVVYLVPSPATAFPVPQSQPWWQANGSPMLSAALGCGKPDHLTPTWPSPSAFSPNTSCSSQQTLPTTSETHQAPSALLAGPPPYAGDKLAAASSSVSSSVNGSATTQRQSAALSVNGVSTARASGCDTSTTSNVSGGNGTASSTAVCPSVMPSASSLPPPAQASQRCFWVDSATGAMKAMTSEELAAAMTADVGSPSAAVPAYAMPPPPPPTGAIASAAAYSVVPPMPFDTTIGPVFSAAMPGALPFIPIVAMPPPPPAPKAVNGLQYEHGETYEGFVKRYNPNRGFGFLTATHHMKADSASSTSASLTGSLTAAPSSSYGSNSTAPPVKERRIPVHVGDIFVHQSYMHMQGFRTLPVGGRVRFRVGYKDGQQTFQAVDVELLPQVVPQNMETSATPAASPNAANASTPSADKASKAFSLRGAVAPTLNSPAPLHPAKSAAEFEKMIGSVGSPIAGGSHTEVCRSFFSGAKDKALCRSPVSPTEGSSINGVDEEEDDSPLIELAYEVYTSLEG